MKSPIKGVIIKELIAHGDGRGWLVEMFRNDELSNKNQPVMAYLSSTKPGVARGPHEHRKQTDLFCFLGFAAFRVYLWDNRIKSASYKKKFIFDCASNKPTLVIVPPGVVHAYKNIGSDDGLVFNAPNRLFRGQHRTQEIDEIRHEENPDSPFRIEE